MIVWSLVKKYNLKLVMGSGNYSQVGYQKRGFCAKGLYPELPGGYLELEPKLTSKYRNRARTDMPRTGTGPEPPICYPVHHYSSIMILKNMNIFKMKFSSN